MPVRQVETVLARQLVKSWRFHLDTPGVLATVPMLRGVWGAALKATSAEAYHVLFEGGAAGVPRYIVRPAPAEVRPAPALEWLLFGPIDPAHESAAWDLATRMGLGPDREPFEILDALPMAWDETPLTPARVQPGFRLALLPTFSGNPTTPDPCPCRLKFPAPLRLIRDKRLIERPSLPDLTLAALRRIHSLAGADPEPAEAANALWADRQSWLDLALELGLIALATDGNLVQRNRKGGIEPDVQTIFDQPFWYCWMYKYDADALGRRYRFSLALVAVLVLLNQAIVEPSLVRLTADTSLINVSGRQRMLSQWLAKTALASERARGLERGRFLQELERVLGLWSTSHEQLRQGVVGRSTEGSNRPTIQAGLDDLEPPYQRIRSAARHLIDLNSRPMAEAGVAAGEPLEIILGNEVEYLRKMEAVVALYESEAQGRINWLRWVGWGVTALILLALLAIGRLVFRPADRLIRLQILELQRARDDLETRVLERTRELEAARKRQRYLLEQFSHVGRVSMLGEMASGLAHELNQPLGAITNYAEGCLNQLRTPQPELNEIRQALERLNEAAIRAGRIIKQVRRFVTRQTATLEPFDPNQAVLEVLEILELDVRQRGIPVHLDLASGLPHVWGDPVQIQQVLVNLVRNALESLGQSQVIEPQLIVSTRLTVTGGVEFLVRDNGEGVARDRIGRVFDAYYSTRAEGMGMGLAISRTIVEAHQGRLQLESEPGVQTTFRFTLSLTGDDDARPDGLHRG